MHKWLVLAGLFQCFLWLCFAPFFEDDEQPTWLPFLVANGAMWCAAAGFLGWVFPVVGYHHVIAGAVIPTCALGTFYSLVKLK